jgi:hypothetical protein
MTSTGADRQDRLRYECRSNSVVTLIDHDTTTFAAGPDAKPVPHPKELKLYFKIQRGSRIQGGNHPQPTKFCARLRP